METVTEFAERVLFSETLEEKLSPPGAGLIDASRRSLGGPLPLPGRPENLRLRSDGVRAEFPGLGKVESDESRGRLLHFFANHELLATELMALVLLKFPDAPDEFRAGVLKTLKEEQMHTKLYLRRMKECGVVFGDLPVNGFFWNLVSPMETPLDYVTRLSLTFEQANLDYSRGYAGVFAEAGDAKTAEVLNRIYEDEISHVHYGLTWFRRWKEQESDWKSYESSLSLPLSAARAKGGFEYNEEGRRRAGLDEEFIRELKVYARSKGRTPNVYWFNPGAEELLAGEGESRASKVISRDLGLLLAFVARREDVVVLDQVPPLEHLLSLRKCGLEVPELVSWDEMNELSSRKLACAEPWAATADAVGKANELGLALKEAPKEMFSKSVHARFLRDVLIQSDWKLLCDQEVVGKVVSSVDELRDWLKSCKWVSAVIKVPYSTAGRGRLNVSCSRGLADKEREWCERMLGKHGELLVEPWLDRVLDFSMQYDRRKNGEVVRRGFVILENSQKGQFQRARVTGRVIDELDEESRRRVFAGGGRRGKMTEWIEETLEVLLVDWLSGFEYFGSVGIDAFFYRDLEGELRLKPIVEMNPRYTMGRVAVELDRYRQEAGETVFGIQSVGKALPEGAHLLTPIDDETQFVAYWGVRGRVNLKGG